jgi:membrane protease subunit HflC
MKKNLITIIIATVLVVVAVLLLFTFQVRQSEIVVVSTFQKPTRSISEPGLYFRWPKPIQSINRFDQRVQIFESKYNEVLTADHTILMSSVYVGWRISDAKEFFPKFYGGSVMEAQKQLELMLRSAMLDAVGHHKLSDFVNSDSSQLQFDAIENTIKDTLQDKLATNNFGMSIEFLGIKKLGLPEQVTQTVFDRMKAERQKYISQSQFEGEKEATEIKSTAERQAADVIANAQAVATRIEGEGVAEAARNLSVFQQDPELAVFQLQLDALKASLNQKSTLIFDERTPPFNLFHNLPADSANK